MVVPTAISAGAMSFGAGKFDALYLTRDPHTLSLQPSLPKPQDVFQPHILSRACSVRVHGLGLGRQQGGWARHATVDRCILL